MPNTSNLEARFRRNAEQARVALACDTPRTRDANSHLSDLGMFDELIRRGQLATYPGNVGTALSLGGLADLKYADETVDDVRAALKAYGEYLVKVAELAA